MHKTHCKVRPLLKHNRGYTPAAQFLFYLFTLTEENSSNVMPLCPLPSGFKNKPGTAQVITNCEFWEKER